MDTALQAGVHQTATPQALEALEREVNAIIERLQQKSANTEASQNLVLQHNLLLQQQVQQLQQQLEQQQQQQQAQTGDDEVAEAFAFWADVLARRVTMLFQSLRSGYAKLKES